MDAADDVDGVGWTGSINSERLRISYGFFAELLKLMQNFDRFVLGVVNLSTLVSPLLMGLLSSTSALSKVMGEWIRGGAGATKLMMGVFGISNTG